MKTIAVVTVGRSDYSIYLPVLRAIQDAPELRLHLIVAGMHLAPEFGLTVDSIVSDGFEVGDRVEMLLSSDTPEGISKSVGIGVAGYAQVYARLRPDVLLVLGDRFEMHAATLAAVPFKISIAHIHGGELTEGAIDDSLRHSMTKLSHLHFVSTEGYAGRVRQLGEEPWRVIVSGAPSLDNLLNMELWGRDELARRFGSFLEVAPLLVTYHPVTLEFEKTEWQTAELMSALEKFDAPIVFTAPNADTSGRTIARMIARFVAEKPSAHLIANLSTQAYFSLMANAAAMVGNSSSGIIEAASVGLPVVNVGNRQRGRLRAGNVIDVSYDAADIGKGIARALSDEFRQSLTGMTNPYGDGQAAGRIVEGLKRFSAEELIPKRFVDAGSLAADTGSR